MQKDKLGTGLFLPSMLQDSRLTHFSKLLSLVNANWESLHLARFLPDDTQEVLFLDWCNESRLEYLQKETYLQLSYKMTGQLAPIIELPSIGVTETMTKTRIYYNLIPDIVMSVLQQVSIEKVFPTKFHMFLTTHMWEQVHEAMEDAHTWYRFDGGSDDNSS
jgi:hypothetical protein